MTQRLGGVEPQADTPPMSSLDQTVQYLQETTRLPPEQVNAPVNPLIAATVTHEKGKNCNVYGTRSADFWSIQYQYCAFVCASPQLDPTQKEVWTRAMQYAYGKYVASIKASIHPRVALAIGHEIDRQNHDSEAELLRMAQQMTEMEIRSEPMNHGGDDMPMMEEVPVVDVPIRCKAKGCRLPNGSTGMLVCQDCCTGFHSTCVNAHFEGSLGRWRCPDHQTCPQCTEPVGYRTELSCSLCDMNYHAKCVGTVNNFGVILPQEEGWLCPACVHCSSCTNRIYTDEKDFMAWSNPALSSIDHIVDPQNKLPMRLCHSCREMKRDETQAQLEAMSCRVCNIPLGSPPPAMSLRTCGQCNTVVHARCMLMTTKYQHGICHACRP